MTEKYFVEYTGIEVKHFRDTLLQHMGNVKKSVFERARHQRQYDRRVNKRLMQTQESKIDMGKAVNDDLVIIESSGTESEVQDNNSRSGNDTGADDADIRPIYDEEPMAKGRQTSLVAGTSITYTPGASGKILGNKGLLSVTTTKGKATCPNSALNQRGNGMINGLRIKCCCNNKVVKELWERIQLLMQGTSLTKQERECKLYDEFDKCTYKKGETLREFYLRFSLLLNDINIYNMKLEQFQVNTNPPEWSKFLTDVKLVWDLHTTNIDQLHAYLGQHEFHANKVCLMHERKSDSLALVTTHQITQSPYQTHQHSYQNTQFQPQVLPYQSLQYGSPYQSQRYSDNQSSPPLSITYPSNDYQSSIHHNIYSSSSFIPKLEYAPLVNQQPNFSQPDSSLIILVFRKGNDPIDVINHMMSFLTAVVTSRYPTTNNQLRNSSNPRQQATINNGRVTLQPIQGRQTSLAVGTTRTYTPRASEQILGNKGLLFVTTAKGKATCPNSALNQRGNDMIHDPGIAKAQATQTVITHNASYQVDDLDVYDSYCVECNTDKVALMENLSHHGLDALVETHNHDNVNNMINHAL
nr:hypothetical protein [Tanacetum cinerariifolium]